MCEKRAGRKPSQYINRNTAYISGKGTKDIHYNLFDASLRTKKYWDTEKRITEKAMELLEICGLADKANELASSLPYGRQRKLEIARALATDMKLLLLDEPAAGSRCWPPAVP